MKWLLLTCLLLGAILATKSETNEEEKTLTINGFESKEQNIENKLEEGGLKVQNIAERRNDNKKKVEKKKNGKEKPVKRKRTSSSSLKLNGNKPETQKKRKGKKWKIQKQKRKRKSRKRKKKKVEKGKKEKKGKKLRNTNGNGNGKAKSKGKGKEKKKKHKNNKKKRRKNVRKKNNKKVKAKNNKKRKQKSKKFKRKQRKEKTKKIKNKKIFAKKKGKRKQIKNNKESSLRNKFEKQATQMSCEEIILSRIKLERKAVNYMRQFNRSKRFMGKTDNKLKKKDIWVKSTEKQDPISLLIKCGGSDEKNLKCAGSTSNKNSIMMMKLLNNLKNCTPNIGSQCDEGKFPAKDAAFDECAANLMAYQAKSIECLKKDGAGACDCYSTTEAKELYEKGKACNAPLMQKYERNVLKTKDNCVSKFKDCRKYQDELAVVMMTCCGTGGECPAA